MKPNISPNLQLGVFLAGSLLVASPAARGNGFPASYFPITQTGAAQTQNNDVRLAQVTAEAEEHFQKGRNRLLNGEVDAARDEFQKALEAIGIAGIESTDKERLRLLYLKFVTRIKQAFEQQINKVPGSSSELENSDTKVSVIISRSEDYFRKGKLSLDENKPVAARDEFDKSIDVILESGLDVRANRRLQSFYLELIERIYREEVPIGHGILIATSQRETQIPATPSRVGFREQKFEPSPLDDLPLLPQERSLRAGSAAANRNPVRSKQQQDAQLGSKPTQ